MTKGHQIPDRRERSRAARKALARRAGVPRIHAKDLVRPSARRRGVSPRASDHLSRLERRLLYLPV